MKQPDHDADRELDALLREAGPDVPRLELGDAARARIMRALAAIGAENPLASAGPAQRPSRWMKGAASAATALAAVLVVALVLQWVGMARARDELATARWETGEVLQLLVSARQTQKSIPPPHDLAGLRGSDLLVITFHHDLCPIARHSTPGFRRLEESHRGEATRFVAFDVTGAKRGGTDREIDAMGIRYALDGPPGAETGVVKVIDTVHDLVLCSAPGRKGLEQAEALLAIASRDEDRP